ncbi:MAG TPA: MFS transporter [Lacunisphaera sp.]|nr:MFS transporter [Lacunisphaera sp.]
MNNWTKLLSLALGAFVIGTESYLVAGVLPALSADLGVTLAVAGQLITAFALTYALSSPVIAVATSGMERRRLLLWSLAAFGVFNLVAATAHTYGVLLMARLGLGLAAGTYMPAASAYAVAATPAAQRGRALSIIYGGLTVALVIGAPLGVLVGGRFGWRFNFVGIAGLTAIALVGLATTLRRIVPSARITLAERLAVARRPDVLALLAGTVFMIAGAYTIYSFLTPFLRTTTGLEGNPIALVFFLFGLGATAGNYLAGGAADRVGPARVVTAVLAGLIVIFGLLSLAGLFLPAGLARWVVVPLVVAWGFVGFSFPAAQQARIAALAPSLAPITLSLNASAIYVGVSLGAMFGGLVVAHGSVPELGWMAALCEVAALTILKLTTRERAEEPDVLEEPAREAA